MKEVSFYFTGVSQVSHAEGVFRSCGAENQTLLRSAPYISTLIASGGGKEATVASRSTQKSPAGNNGRPNVYSK